MATIEYSYHIRYNIVPHIERRWLGSQVGFFFSNKNTLRGCWCYVFIQFHVKLYNFDGVFVWKIAFLFWESLNKIYIFVLFVLKKIPNDYTM